MTTKAATRYLSPTQVAEQLGVHVDTVGDWIRTGHLPARNIAASTRRACWRISQDALDRWVANRPTT